MMPWDGEEMHFSSLKKELIKNNYMKMSDKYIKAQKKRKKELERYHKERGLSIEEFKQAREEDKKRLTKKQ